MKALLSGILQSKTAHYIRSWIPIRDSVMRIFENGNYAAGFCSTVQTSLISTGVGCGPRL
jgi:hypothetical protein